MGVVCRHAGRREGPWPLQHLDHGHQVPCKGRVHVITEVVATAIGTS